MRIRRDSNVRDAVWCAPRQCLSPRANARVAKTMRMLMRGVPSCRRRLGYGAKFIRRFVVVCRFSGKSKPRGAMSALGHRKLADALLPYGAASKRKHCVHNGLGQPLQQQPDQPLLSYNRLHPPSPWLNPDSLYPYGREFTGGTSVFRTICGHNSS
jgi:hypothetical protein